MARAGHIAGGHEQGMVEAKSWQEQDMLQEAMSRAWWRHPWGEFDEVNALPCQVHLLLMGRVHRSEMILPGRGGRLLGMGAMGDMGNGTHGAMGILGGMPFPTLRCANGLGCTRIEMMA